MFDGIGMTFDHDHFAFLSAAIFCFSTMGQAKPRHIDLDKIEIPGTSSDDVETMTTIQADDGGRKVELQASTKQLSTRCLVMMLGLLWVGKVTFDFLEARTIDWKAARGSSCGLRFVQIDVYFNHVESG